MDACRQGLTRLSIKDATDERWASAVTTSVTPSGRFQAKQLRVDVVTGVEREVSAQVLRLFGIAALAVFSPWVVQRIQKGREEERTSAPPRPARHQVEVHEAERRWPERRRRDRRWLAPKEAAKRVAEPALAELLGEFRVNPRKSAA